jgi:hypothetical protein
MNAVYKHREWHRKLNIVAVATAFIAVGLLYLGYNLGMVERQVLHTVVSWQMLLIFIGVVQLVKRHYVGGLILMAVGAYFIVPSGFGLAAYWPVLLILIGLAFLLQLRRPHGFCRHGHGHGHGWWGSARSKEEATTEDGYVRADVAFGESNQIVLDPVFRGADLSVSFGSVTLDLRRSTLEAPVTYINVHANFSGVEIYVPLHWYVVVEVGTTLSGVDDKRPQKVDTDRDHQLVIRGDIAFSGVEVKG